MFTDCRRFYYGSPICNKPCGCVEDHSVSCDSLTSACQCRSGWRGKKCEVDIDECVALIHSCVETERCTNTPGSFTCQPGT